MEAPTIHPVVWDGRYVCAKLHIESADALSNPKTLGAVRCALSTSSVWDPYSRQRFLACMAEKGIALDDPAVTSVLNLMPAEECFNHKLGQDASVEDLLNATDQRLLCLSYVKSGLENFLHHFICVIPRNITVEATDEDEMIEFYR